MVLFHMILVPLLLRHNVLRISYSLGSKIHTAKQSRMK